MTQIEFFNLFMQQKYQVGCFCQRDHDAFVGELLQTTGLDLKKNGHWAGYSSNYPYLFWSDDGDHIVGGRHALSHRGAAISYADYLSMIEPEVEPIAVSLAEVL